MMLRVTHLLKGEDFSLFMRSYWPKVEITNGFWTPPGAVKAN